MAPDRRRWIRRLAWAAAGGAWLLWLGYEDRGAATPVGMAAILAAAWALGAILNAQRAAPPAARMMLIGLASGAAVGPLAALLMLIKISIHSHPSLDFTPADLTAAVRRTPIWAAAGLLAGAGAALLAAARRGSSPTARDAHGIVEAGDLSEVQSSSPREDDDE